MRNWGSKHVNDLSKVRAICLTMTWWSFLILNHSISFNNDHKIPDTAQALQLSPLEKWSPSLSFHLHFPERLGSPLWDLNQVPGLRSRESWEYDTICSNWSSPPLTLLLFSPLLKPLFLRIFMYQCTLWFCLECSTAEFRARKGLKISNSTTSFDRWEKPYLKNT